MEYVYTQKYLRASPQKIREVTDMVRSMDPLKALAVLKFINKASAVFLSKAINTAIANAKNQGVAQENLVIKEIQINEGPRLKRGRPVARGAWHPYKKRMSHIRVVLTSKSVKATKGKQVAERGQGSKLKQKTRELENVIAKRSKK